MIVCASDPYATPLLSERDLAVPYNRSYTILTAKVTTLGVIKGRSLSRCIYQLSIPSPLGMEGKLELWGKHLPQVQR